MCASPTALQLQQRSPFHFHTCLRGQKKKIIATTFLPIFFAINGTHARAMSSRWFGLRSAVLLLLLAIIWNKHLHCTFALFIRFPWIFFQFFFFVIFHFLAMPNFDFDAYVLMGQLACVPTWVCVRQ